MTLVLELSPEIEAQLRAEAQSRHVPVEEVAARAVEIYISISTMLEAPLGSGKTSTALANAEQQRRLTGLARLGSYTGGSMLESDDDRSTLYSDGLDESELGLR